MKTSDLTAQRMKEYLKQGKRFDGRKPEQMRDMEIEFGVSKKAEGSVRVKMGKTEVIVGVKMDIGTPYADSANKGNLMTTAELLPLSSPRFEAGPPSFESIELSRVIDRGIRESGFIDFEKLCVKEGEKVWTVFVDIYSINDDGNLFDAAGIGAVIALKNSMIPKYDTEKEQVLHGELSDTPFPVTEKLPFALTFHKIGDAIVIDPTREEEDISEARVTIGSSHGSISSMQKGNSGTLTSEEMNKILDLIEPTWNELFKKVEKHLK